VEKPKLFSRLLTLLFHSYLDDEHNVTGRLLGICKDMQLDASWREVILATHTALANDSLVAAAGAHMIAKAAKGHQTPVVVLSGVYELNSVHCPMVFTIVTNNRSLLQICILDMEQ
jgi:hypothetical protein